MKILELNLHDNVLKVSAVFILHVLLLLISLSCSYDKGTILKTDQTEKKGYIRFDECSDRYPGNSKENFIEFKESILSGWERIPSIDAAEVNKDGRTYIYIESKKISGDHGPSAKIPAILILDGEAQVYMYCSIKYMNTMLSSKRMDMLVYLLSKKGEDKFFVIPHDVEQFKNFSAEHLSSCPEIVNDIKNLKFKKKIENPIPGNITDYEFVDENDIAGFVSRYNECIKPRRR